MEQLEVGGHVPLFHSDTVNPAQFSIDHIKEEGNRISARTSAFGFSETIPEDDDINEGGEQMRVNPHDSTLLPDCSLRDSITADV